MSTACEGGEHARAHAQPRASQAGCIRSCFFSASIRLSGVVAARECALGMRACRGAARAGGRRAAGGGVARQGRQAAQRREESSFLRT